MSQTDKHDHDHSADGDHDHDGAGDDGAASAIDQEKAQARAERLRTAVLLASPEALRKALGELPDSALREMATPTGMPATVLKRASNPAPRLRRITEVKHLALLSEYLVSDVVEDTVEVLGEAADDPTHEQLVAAIKTVSERHPPEDIRAMLTYVAATGQPAADVCDQILSEDERYAVPDELPEDDTTAIKPGVPAPTPISLRTASPEVRAARKARRAEEQEERRRQAEVAATAAKVGKAAKRRKLRKANAADDALDD